MRIEAGTDNEAATTLRSCPLSPLRRRAPAPACRCHAHASSSSYPHLQHPHLHPHLRPHLTSLPPRRLVVAVVTSLCRRVAVELSCHSAVVAAAFPASSPPRRLVSPGIVSSRRHRAVASLFGVPRCTFVVAAPVFRASRCTVVVVPVVVATLRCRHTAVVAQVVIATPSATVQPSAAPSSPQPSSP